MNRARRLLALLVPLCLIPSLMATAAARATVAAPTVVLTSPTSAYVGDEQVRITATGTFGSSDSSQEPTSFQLLVDGLDVPDAAATCNDFVSAISCGTVLTWSSRGETGEHTLQVLMTTNTGRTAVTAVQHVTVITPLRPTLVVTGPLEGSTNSGTVTVTATATVDPRYGDKPLGMTLLLGLGWDYRYPYTDLTACAYGSVPGTCSVTFPLAGNAFGGITEYEVILQTDQTTVTRIGPLALPSVEIEQPAANAASSGKNWIRASGTADAPSGDSTRSLALLVDEAPYGGSLTCPQENPHTCTMDLPLDADGLSAGPHQVVAILTTATTFVRSAPLNIYVQHSVPQAALVSLAAAQPVVRGSRYAPRGLVTDSVTHTGIAGVPVTVTFTPAAGPSATVLVLTDTEGSFSSAVPGGLGNTSVMRATVPAGYGSSSASSVLTVSLPMACSVPGRLRQGRRATITCDVRGLENGTTVRLVSVGSHNVAVLGRARAKSGRVRIGILPAKGIHHLTIRATTAASRLFVASESPTYVLRIS